MSTLVSFYTTRIDLNELYVMSNVKRPEKQTGPIPSCMSCLNFLCAFYFSIKVSLLWSHHPSKLLGTSWSPGSVDVVGGHGTTESKAVLGRRMMEQKHVWNTLRTRFLNLASKIVVYNCLLQVCLCVCVRGELKSFNNKLSGPTNKTTGS